MIVKSRGLKQANTQKEKFGQTNLLGGQWEFSGFHYGTVWSNYSGQFGDNRKPN